MHRWPSKKNDHHRQNEFTIQLILWITARERELNTLLQCHPTPPPPRNAKTPKSLNIPIEDAQFQASLHWQLPHSACNSLCFSIACVKNWKLYFQPQFCVASFKSSLNPPAKETFLNLGTADVFGPIILCCERYGCPACCRMFSHIPALQPLRCQEHLASCNNKTSPDIVSCGGGGKGNVTTRVF